MSSKPLTQLSDDPFVSMNDEAENKQSSPEKARLLAVPTPASLMPPWAHRILEAPHPASRGCFTQSQIFQSSSGVSEPQIQTSKPQPIAAYDFRRPRSNTEMLPPSGVPPTNHHMSRSVGSSSDAPQPQSFRDDGLINDAPEVLNRLFRPVTSPIPEVSDNSPVLPESARFPSGYMDDGQATPGGVKLPDEGLGGGLPDHEGTARAFIQPQYGMIPPQVPTPFTPASVSMHPTQTGGASLPAPFNPASNQFQPQYAQEMPRTDHVIPDDNEYTIARQRARELASFIRSGGLEDPTRVQPMHPMHNSERSFSEPILGMPQVQAGAQQYSHGTRVPSQTVPHMEDRDPLAECMTETIQKGAINITLLKAHVPLRETTQNVKPSTAGVVRVEEIPYNTTRQEMIAFFGRNARFLNQPSGSPFYAVHIMMERGSAKSMDCYVEFEDEREASEAVRRATRPMQTNNRKPRIGDRVVHVHESSQALFMQAIFPRAKSVQWQGQEPLVQEKPPSNEPYNNNFKGFVTREEMHMVAKFATTPTRSRFAGKHIQRTYESMISLTNKYPWWATHLYTIEERDSIFNTLREQLDELSNIIGSGCGTLQLTPQLLEELLYSALDCPGFSESQRYVLQKASRGIVGHPRFLSNSAQFIPFLTLQRRVDLSEQLSGVVLHYMQQAAWFNLGSEGQMQPLNWDDPFCCIRALLGSPPIEAKMSDVANHEMAVVDSLLNTIVEHAGSAHFQSPPPQIPPMLQRDPGLIHQPPGPLDPYANRPFQLPPPQYDPTQDHSTMQSPS